MDTQPHTSDAHELETGAFGQATDERETVAAGEAPVADEAAAAGNTAANEAQVADEVAAAGEAPAANPQPADTPAANEATAADDAADDKLPTPSFPIPLPPEPDRTGKTWERPSWKSLIVTGVTYAGVAAAATVGLVVTEHAVAAGLVAGGAALGAFGGTKLAGVGARTLLRAPHNATLNQEEQQYLKEHPDGKEAESLRRTERLGRMLVEREGEPFTTSFCSNTPEQAETLSHNRAEEAEASLEWLNGDDEAELASKGKHFDPEEFFARRLPPEQVEVHITTDEGVGLTGHLLMANREQHRWVIMAHGYVGNWTEMIIYARKWAERGYNLLLCEMRGHGTSGGEYIGMGWLDRRDLVSWARWLVQNCCAERIVLHGHSMGGASVCLASCEPDLPAEVVATVSDSAYTDLVNVFGRILREGFHAPAHPTIEIMRAGFALTRDGYDLGKAAPEDAFRLGARVPVLLFHGENDTFVSPYMGPRLYNALEGAPDRRLVMVEGAGHCQCALAAPEQYWQAIDEFVETR